MRLLSVIVLSLSLIACGSSSDDSSDPSNENAGLSEDTDNKEALGGQTYTDFFGQNGNLWKPVADDHGASPGNLVVLMGGQYSTQFESCSVKLNTGETRALTCINNVPWTHHPNSCFGNPDATGDRQHWRADFRCGAAAIVEVICSLGADTYVFQAPNGRSGEVCSRLG